MLTVIAALVVIGLLLLLASAIWEKPPLLWSSVLMLFLVELLRILPIGK